MLLFCCLWIFQQWAFIQFSKRQRLFFDCLPAAWVQHLSIKVESTMITFWSVIKWNLLSKVAALGLCLSDYLKYKVPAWLHSQSVLSPGGKYHEEMLSIMDIKLNNLQYQCKPQIIKCSSWVGHLSWHKLFLSKKYACLGVHNKFPNKVKCLDPIREMSVV